MFVTLNLFNICIFQEIMAQSLQPLPIGSIAPNFSVKNVLDDTEEDLHEIVKQYDGVLVNFFRGEYWPYCKHYFRRLTKKIKKFTQKNILIISIAPDSKKNLQKLAFPMILISDLPQGLISKQYNAFKLTESKKSGKKFKDVEPFSYLVNPQGKIVWSYPGTKEKRPSNRKIFAAIDKYLSK